MKAIILAAGQGTRLKKYTENLPKGMLEFMGKTIIERQIEMYRQCGIEYIVVVKGFAADKINYPNVKYYLNRNYAKTNMVETMMSAKNEFDDEIIVSYSDILFEEQILRSMMGSTDDFTVAVDDSWKKYWKKRYGRIDFDTESLSIVEKGNIISPDGLKHMEDILEEAYRKYQDKPWQQSGKTVRKAYMTDLLNAVIQTGRPVKANIFQNGWIEFDTNEDYENAVQWVQDGSINELLKIYV